MVPLLVRNAVVGSAGDGAAQVSSSPRAEARPLGDLQSAKNGSTVSMATVREKAPAYVGQGYWGTYVQEIGPYGDGGAPSGSTTLVANASTARDWR